jgi:hypothetical protein
MNNFNLSLFKPFWLLNLLIISSLSANLVMADEEICPTEDASTLENCKDKTIQISGPRAGMFDVPEYFMLADPSFTGGEGLQDYLIFSETNIILHTKEEVQCPEELTVKGLLKQMDLEGNLTWIIEVAEFKCKE